MTATTSNGTDRRPVRNGERRKSRRLARGVAALALAVGATGVTTMVGAAPASAAGSYIGSNSGGAWVRTCASMSCFQKTWLTNGTPVTMQCWLDGQWVNPPNSDYGSARWFRISGYEGYVHSSLVERQTSVPHC
jgi:hypothetical protein